MQQETYTERRAAPRFHKPPLLPHLDVELTERCNNACLHCYINRPAGDALARKRELTTAQWLDIFAQAAGLGALSLRFTGGEPLLRDDFAELYTGARRLGLKVALFTNARRITPEIAGLLARIPPLEKVEVTVYGMQPATYDAAARAPGAYREFRQGVQNLLDSGVPFLLKGALLPQAQPEMPALDSWAASLPWRQDPPGYAMFFDLRGRRDSEARNQKIRQLRVAPRAGVALLTRRNPNFLEESRQFCARFIGPAGDALFTCGAGEKACVDAYGMVQPCMLLRDPTLAYSLRAGSLREAVTGSFLSLKTMRAADPLYLERCARCFLHGLCEQCPAKSWMEHGTLDTPVEYLCQVAHEKARLLGLLEEGEAAWEVVDWQLRLARLESGEKPR